MLYQLAPGIREIRTAIASGYVWLVLVWLLLNDDVSNAGPPVADLVDLSESVSAVGLGFALTFVAYLVGSLSDDVFVRLLVKRERWQAASDGQVGEDIERLTDDELVREELARLENDLGRTESESRLRITLIPPLAALIVYLAIVGAPLWLLGLLGVGALGWQARLRYQEWCGSYATLRDFRETHDLLEPPDMGSGSGS